MHWFVSLLALVLTCGAQAHMLNMTHIEVTLDEHGQGMLTVNVDLGQSLMTPGDYWTAANQSLPTAFPPFANALAKLEAALELQLAGAPVAVHRSSIQLQADSLDAIANPLMPQMAVISYTFSAPDAAAEVAVSIAPDVEVPWPGLVRLDVSGSELPRSRVLTTETRSVRFVSMPGESLDPFEALVQRWSQIAPQATWIAVGFQHIVPFGLDHMLFILGLFFLAGGWRVLLLQVTCFTLAHSLTLALATLGLVTASPQIIEPLIALSIVYVAIDNLYATHLARWRLVIISAFGLLHGMGFAAVLSDVGLPEEGFLTALALFNVGVELGQIAVLAAAFLLVGWWRKHIWYERSIAMPAAVAIAGTGAYWFIKRVAL